MDSRTKIAVRYASAVAAVAVGGLLYLALTKLVGPGLPTYITFYPAVMTAVLLGGTLPGMLATLLSVLVTDYWFLPPAGFGVETPVDAVGLAVFAIMGIAISVVAGEYRQGRERLSTLVADRTRELSNANTALQELNRELEHRVTVKTDELRQANATLEQRVAERTTEVITSNTALRESRLAALNLMEDAIAARRQAERVNSDLRKERDFTAAILENTGALVTVLDREGRITRFNRACEETTGYTQAEVLGHVFWELLVPLEDIPDVIKVWTSLRSGHFPNQHENHWITKNGQQRLIAWSNTAIAREDGTVEFVIATGVDITARTMAEQEFLRTARELARSNKDLEQFAHVTSHDLKEPLRMVTGFTSLLKERCAGRLDSKALEYIGLASEAAGRMQRMVDDLLAYARAGRANTVEPVDINVVVDSALQNLKMAIDESGAMITRDPLPTLSGHAPGLTQLFQNLIGNAIKFRSHGTRPEIHIGTKRMPEQEHPSPGSRKGNTVVQMPDSGSLTLQNYHGSQSAFWLFSVRDNGIGIDPRFMDRIFMIFQRLHTRDEYPGSGVGLAICKKIVEQHGGHIWVDSTPGKGSVFSFTLPDTIKRSSDNAG